MVRRQARQLQRRLRLSPIASGRPDRVPRRPGSLTPPRLLRKRRHERHLDPQDAGEGDDLRTVCRPRGLLEPRALPRRQPGRSDPRSGVLLRHRERDRRVDPAGSQDDRRHGRRRLAGGQSPRRLELLGRDAVGRPPLPVRGRWPRAGEDRLPVVLDRRRPASGGRHVSGPWMSGRVPASHRSAHVPGPVSDHGPVPRRDAVHPRGRAPRARRDLALEWGLLHDARRLLERVGRTRPARPRPDVFERPHRLRRPD